MLGRKGKEKRRSGEARASPGWTDFLGFSGTKEVPDVNEEDLEAELRALTGEGGRKKPRKDKPKKMSLAEIDALVAGIGDVGGDPSDSDEEVDDEELLAELKELEDDEEAEPDEVIEVRPSKERASAEYVSANVQKIQARERMYQDALTFAKQNGETSKVCRFERALHRIADMSRDAMAGKPVDLDDLPPQVATSAGKCSERDDQFQVKNQRAGTQQEMAVKESPSGVTESPLQGKIQQRMKLYEEVLKQTDEPSKVKRYNRAIKSMQQMLQDAKLGKRVDIEMLPPEISLPSKHVSKGQSANSSPGNLIDLDAPEFDEFNVSEEDMAALAATLVDDRHTKVESSKSSSTVQPGLSLQTSPLPPPQQPPKVLPKPVAPARPAGLIDLDTPEFSEFDLSDADMEALAATMVDDRAEKEKKKLSPGIPVGHGDSTPVNTQQKPPQKVPSKELVRAVLCERKQQYSDAMRKAKASGDGDTAMRLGKTAVLFNKSIKALDQGASLDLSSVPPPPPGYRTEYSDVNLSLFSSSVSHPPASASSLAPSPLVKPPDDGADEQDPVDPSIPAPTSVLASLQQRLEKYQEGLDTATQKGESSRVRRMGRIIKSYENAIKLTKAGKPVDYSDLPTPPGFPPIPVGQTSVTQSVPATTSGRKPVSSVSAVPATKSLPAKTVAQTITSSVSDQQLQLVLQRSAEFKQAAQASKTSGDKENALKYMRQYKALQQLILAAQGGLPINMAQVPPSPYADTTTAKPSSQVLAHLKQATDDDSNTFDLIEQQLQQQIDVCNGNADTYEQLGNLPAMTQYRNMAMQCQRDLLAIKGIRSQNLGPPKFTMEMRTFAIVNSNPHISDKQIEVTVIKGITIPPPGKDYSEDDLNLYVEVEFPWPQDNPQKCQTDAIRGSSSPQFNKKCLFDIDRKQSRSLLRTFKRHRVKCQVYQRRSLRRDIFIGQANVSLEAMENKCEFHVSEDLKDEKGRKPIGGKLEVMIRLREPLTGRDQQEKEQKWLVFQEPIAAEPTVHMPVPVAIPQSSATSPIEVDNTTSVDALKLEFRLVQSALKSGQKNQALLQRGRQIQSRLQIVQQRLQQDANYRKQYIQQVSHEIQQEKVLEQKLAKAGRNAEVKIIQGRRRVMESEMSKWIKK